MRGDKILLMLILSPTLTALLGFQTALSGILLCGLSASFLSSSQGSDKKNRNREIMAGVIIIFVTALCIWLWFSSATKLPPPPPPSEEAPYRNPNLTPEERATDLLSRMTLEEKIGQMTLVDRQSISSISDISTYYLGGLLSGGGSCPDPNVPWNWAGMYNEFERGC